MIRTIVVGSLSVPHLAYTDIVHREGPVMALQSPLALATETPERT